MAFYMCNRVAELLSTSNQGKAYSEHIDMIDAWDKLDFSHPPFTKSLIVFL